VINPISPKMAGVLSANARLKQLCRISGGTAIIQVESLVSEIEWLVSDLWCSSHRRLQELLPVYCCFW